MKLIGIVVVFVKIAQIIKNMLDGFEKNRIEILQGLNFLNLFFILVSILSIKESPLFNFINILIHLNLL